MNTENQKPYFSATQLNMGCRCGEQYRRVYEEGERMPPGVAMIKGTAVHGAAEVNFEQKIVSHVDLPVSLGVDAAVAKYEERVEAEGVALSPDELSRGKHVVISEGKDRVAKMSEFHMLVQAPEYQPVIVEEKQRLELPNCSRDLVGIIDLVDDKNRLIDLKTGSTKAKEHDAHHSIQLSVYAAMVRSSTGDYPEEVRLDRIVDTKSTKTDPVRQLIRTHRNDASVDALCARVTAFESTVIAGNYLPVEPGHWICNPERCGFWSTCRFVDSERIAKSK